MKKLLLTLIFYLITISFHCQSVQWAKHSYSEVSLGMVSINSKCYYLQRTASQFCCGSGNSLIGINQTGSVILSLSINYKPIYYVLGIYTTYDKNILVFGKGSTACDYSLKNYLLAYDTTGTLLYSLEGNSGAVAPYPDGTIYIGNSNELTHYGTSGQTLAKINLGISGITSLNYINNGHLLVSYTMNNQPKLREITTSGAIIYDIVAPNAIGKVSRTSSGSFIALAGGTLQKYAFYLGYIKNSVSSLGQVTIADFDFRNDSIFVTGINTVGKTFYYILDTDFDILYQTVSNCSRINSTGIVLDTKNNINIVSSGTSGSPNTSSFIGFFQTSITGSINSLPDIGVKSYTVTNAYYKPIFGEYYNGNFELNVTVKNYGIDTVKSFNINHGSYTIGVAFGSGSCLGFFNKPFSVTIPPGDSVILNKIAISVLIHSVEIGANGFVKRSECMFTTIPNGCNDVNCYNDYFCDSIKMIFVGINEQTFLETNLKVFPNPTRGRFTVSSEREIQHIEIIDPTGHVSRTFVVNQKKIDLDLPGEGLFLLRITTEKGTVVRKVVSE